MNTTTIGTHKNPSKYLHTATLEHVTYITEYFYNGAKIENPTADQKMLCSIFGESKRSEVRKVIGEISYRTIAEMNTKFYDMCREKDIHSSDVQIKK